MFLEGKCEQEVSMHIHSNALRMAAFSLQRPITHSRPQLSSEQSPDTLLLAQQYTEHGQRGERRVQSPSMTRTPPKHQKWPKGHLGGGGGGRGGEGLGAQWPVLQTE